MEQTLHRTHAKQWRLLLECRVGCAHRAGNQSSVLGRHGLASALAAWSQGPSPQLLDSSAPSMEALVGASGPDAASSPTVLATVGHDIHQTGNQRSEMLVRHLPNEIEANAANSMSSRSSASRAGKSAIDCLGVS